MKMPLVFDIARGSYEDGPGIRTVVFFKGCPLKCVWCQNPESQRAEAEELFYAERCIKCGRCADGCHSLARRKAGDFYEPGKLARLILRDKIFYETSSGGVTFSGGEPLMYIDYILQVSKRLKEDKIHIAVETSGYFDFEKLEKGLLPLIDLFLFDIKILDPVKHLEFTGKDNRRILRNLEKLLKNGSTVMPRIPLVPGYTATKENLSGIAELLKNHELTEYELLTYNPSGLDKWERLGKEKPVGVPESPMTMEEENKWRTFFEAHMKKTTIGDLRE
jgi:pyruvate formate lyase activating enzyme